MRWRSRSHAVPRIIGNHAISGGPGQRSLLDVATLVTGAVVPTVTVIACAAPPLICTEALDRVQVGGGVTAGVIPHFRLTVPANDPDGARDKVNIALCPALTVFEVDDPGAGEIVKSGAAEPIPDKAIVCGLVGALSLIVRVPDRLPVAVGPNSTEI